MSFLVPNTLLSYYIFKRGEGELIGKVPSLQVMTHLAGVRWRILFHVPAAERMECCVSERCCVHCGPHFLGASREPSIISAECQGGGSEWKANGTPVLGTCGLLDVLAYNSHGPSLLARLARAAGISYVPL